MGIDSRARAHEAARFDAHRVRWRRVLTSDRAVESIALLKTNRSPFSLPTTRSKGRGNVNTAAGDNQVRRERELIKVLILLFRAKRGELFVVNLEDPQQ